MTASIKQKSPGSPDKPEPATSFCRGCTWPSAYFYAALLDKQLLAKSNVFHNNVLFAPEYGPEKLKDELGKDFQC